VSEFVLYDDWLARQMEPFALSRPTGELRAGALVTRHRWERTLTARCISFVAAPHLASFTEFDAPPAETRGELPAGTVIANSRCIAGLDANGDADVWETEGGVAAVRLERALPLRDLADGTCDLGTLVSPRHRRTHLRARWLQAPWDLVAQLPATLAEDVLALGGGQATPRPAGVTVLGDHPVFVQPGARVEPLVVIDASAGPVLISSGATVAAFTRLVGPLFVAPEAQILGGKVGVSSIGEQCRVHGEVSTTIFIGYANKGHDGFVGHSVLGRWVNLGAATVTSNLKNTYGSVQLWTPGGLRDTALQFLGTLFGDHAKTAIGSRLTTGSVIGTGANVVGTGMTPKVVDPFRWADGSTLYDPARFTEVAARVMQRRGVSLGEDGRRHLERVYAARWSTT